MSEAAEARWNRAGLAAALFALDPRAIGGLWLRARTGPVRDRFLAALTGATGRLPKIAPQITDESLYGGLDLAGTLETGRLVTRTGILHAGHGALHLTMAERARGGLAARLAAARDAGGPGLLAVDEGIEADERLDGALSDRLALHLDLDGLPLSDAPAFAIPDLTEARALYPSVIAGDEARDALVRTAVMLGIDSLRAPLLALAAARGLAALGGADAIEEGEVEGAVELVLAPRATRLPAPPEEEEEDGRDEEAEGPNPDEDDTRDDEDGPDPENDDLPPDLAERLIEAARAVLPDGVLGPAASAAPRGAGSGGAGARHSGNRRGRPLPPRPGHPGEGRRIDIVATLRAAAPWQPIRRAQHPDRAGLQIRPADIRLKRFEEQSDRLVVFAVDASGSAAAARLAEAKGAVELLLSQAYARRDQVALIGFRKDGAEILLPPTRSLVQTKRRLAGLPGGGGTPLAAGLRAAADLAVQMRRRGLSPLLAVLTDGRGNIALDGRADRRQAAEDARQMARLIRTEGLEAVVLDTAVRPQAALSELAREMGGRYLPLPRADASRLGAALQAADA